MKNEHYAIAQDPETDLWVVTYTGRNNVPVPIYEGETEDAANAYAKKHDFKIALRESVRFFYDAQKLRIQAGLRGGTDTVILSDKQIAHLGQQSDNLSAIERQELSNIRRLLRQHPMYPWLKAQKGVGPTMAGVLLAYINIEGCHTVSHLWSWCGLAVDPDGKAQRRKKGEKAGYNPWLKAKLVKVLGDSFIKCRSPWREFYDSYKHRKQHTLVDCMLCAGTGKYDKKTCSNCSGTGKGPWGRSDAHRHQASVRYMVKIFLSHFWEEWRKIEGLPTPDTYAEAMLGRKHGDHGGVHPTKGRWDQNDSAVEH